MLNVCEHLSWRFGFSDVRSMASVTFGILFLYASIIFGKSKEPRETRVIKLSQKFSILQ